MDLVRFDVMCTECLVEYEAGPADIKRGYRHWSRCPACRATAPSDLCKTRQSDENDAKASEIIQP